MLSLSGNEVRSPSCASSARADLHYAAAPDGSHLPSTFAKSPFCRQCRTNQTLQIALLAGFPVDDDGDGDGTEPGSSAFPHLLPEYKASLESRYPIVCSSCAPSVEQIIAERDYRAQTQALGWRLRASKKARMKAEAKQREIRGSWKWRVMGWLWKLRGGLWWLTHAAGIGASTAGTRTVAGSVVLVSAQNSLARQVSFARICSGTYAHVVAASYGPRYSV